MVFARGSRRGIVRFGREVIERSSGIELVGSGKEMVSFLTALVGLITALVTLMVARRGRRQDHGRVTTLVVEADTLRRRLLRQARRKIANEQARLGRLESECEHIGVDLAGLPAHARCAITDPRDTEAEARLVHDLLEAELGVFATAPPADQRRRRGSRRRAR